MEVFVDDETKLTLHGLQQYYVKLKDSEKNRKLFDLLDVLEFNQVMLPHSWGLSWGSKPLGGILALTAAPSLTGGDICEVGAALHGLGPAPRGAELPSHCHPQGHGPGGAVSACRPQSPRQAPWRGTPPRIDLTSPHPAPTTGVHTGEPPGLPGGQTQGNLQDTAVARRQVRGLSICLRARIITTTALNIYQAQALSCPRTVAPSHRCRLKYGSTLKW